MRVLTFCVVLVGFGFSGPTYNRSFAQQPAGEEQDGAIDALPSAELPAIRDALERIAASQEAEEARSEAEARDTKEADDLKAQQDMAFWARWMFWATAASVVLSAFGLGALLYSLHLNRKATEASANAVEVATASLHSDRAWMTYGAVMQTPITDTVMQEGSATKIHLGMRLAIEWQNTGRSPARLAQVSQHLWRIVVANPTGDRPAYADPTTNAPIELKGPNSIVTAPAVTLLPEWLGPIQNGQLLCLLMSKIWYRTIFDDTLRWTEVCLQVEVLGAIEHPEHGKIPALQFRTFGPDNGGT